MAIAQDIAAIRGAAYGKDVREAIAHGIEQCYTDVTNSSTMANTAANSANTAASSANQNSQAANKAAQAAKAAAQTVDNKVAESVGNIVLVQDTQPTETDNKIWIKPESDEYKVPTWEEFQELSGKVDPDTQDIADLDERKANIDGYYPDMTVGNAEQLNSSKFVENSEPYTLRTSGGSADVGNREYVDKIVGGTVAWNQMVRDEASPNETEYADVVTVTDSVEDAAGVKVKIEPAQDLHGYDYPWPAGGGKNLLEITATTQTVNGVTFTINKDSAGNIVSVTVNGTATGNAYFAIKRNVDIKAGSYVMTGCPTGGSASTYSLSSQINSAWQGSDYGDGRNLNLSADGNGETASRIEIVIMNGYTANNLVFRPMIRLATEADSAFEPYSNICPITGWTAAKVSRTGKNLLPMPIKSGSYNYTMTVSVNADKSFYVTKTSSAGWTRFDLCTNYYLPAGTYTFIHSDDGSANASCSISNAKTGKAITDTRYTKTRTLTFDTGVYLDINYARSASADNVLTKLMLFMGDTATADDYEPYQGDTYDITIPTEAGTVYGGTLDTAKGELVVDRVIKEVPSASIAGPAIAYSTYQIGKYGDVNRDIRQVSNALMAHEGNVSNLTPGTFACFNSSGYSKALVAFCFVGCRGADAAETLALNKAKLQELEQAGTPMRVCYGLTTPITYTLTPTEIRTLLGENNVWSDIGQVSLTYTGTHEFLTLQNGRKYLTRIDGTDAMVAGTGQTLEAVKGTDNVFDLTQMFGSAVADTAYGQGATWFKRYFPNDYYDYNAGELISVSGLQSHDMVGFNQWDEEWVNGFIDGNGAFVSRTDIVGSKNAIPVLPSTRYYFKRPGTAYITFWRKPAAYNELNAEDFISRISRNEGIVEFLTPSDCHAIHFNMLNTYGNSYKHDICINLSHNGSRNGKYEPYAKHSYPLDSSLTLRGIPKLSADNQLYFDGDEYLPEGKVNRRYGVVDLGTLTWAISDGLFYAVLNDRYENNVSGSGVCSTYPFYGRRRWGTLVNELPDKQFAFTTDSAKKYIIIKNSTYSDAAAFKTAMSGVMLVYELATPTEETAEPYNEVQLVDDWGTEEYISGTICPVGHETRYPANLRDKLQHLPDAASENGSYLIQQTDGQMVLTPFPAPPSMAGNYVLKATVTNGVPTYTWEVAT